MIEKDDISFFRMKTKMKKVHHVLLTLCFYEHPAAKAHLDFWEKAMGNKITEKIEFDENLFYEVKKEKNKSELIYCIRLGSVPYFKYLNVEYLNVESVLTARNKTFKVKYFKTLIFGKVSRKDLLEIERFEDELIKNMKI